MSEQTGCCSEFAVAVDGFGHGLGFRMEVDPVTGEIVIVDRDGDEVNDEDRAKIAGWVHGIPDNDPNPENDPGVGEPNWERCSGIPCSVTEDDDEDE